MKFTAEFRVNPPPRSLARSTSSLTMIACRRHEQQSIAAALATSHHHSALREQKKARAGEGDFELHFTAKIRRHPPLQAAGTVYYPMDVDDVPAASGSRPDRLVDVRPQERVPRRIVEQLVDYVPVVPLLDAPVPQTVDQLVEVLRPLDTVVPEHVIEVPKITLHDAIPQRAVLPVPQMAEHLVDEPVPSLTSSWLRQAKRRRRRRYPPLRTSRRRRQERGGGGGGDAAHGPGVSRLGR